MSSIQHNWSLNPITALRFFQTKNRSILLAGEGNYLKIYDITSGLHQIIAECEIFEEQAIHGIACQPLSATSQGSSIAIWGGRSFTILDSEHIDLIIQNSLENVCDLVQLAPDWILDGALSPFRDDLECIFITAHSAGVRIRLPKRDGLPVQAPSYSQYPFLSQDILRSPSQSILYSAYIVWTSRDRILVAAGTVFGKIEVIRWTLSSPTESVGFLDLTLNGHEGSIFGVNISDPIIGHDGKPTRLLASCSDDRTVRVWDLSIQNDIQNVSKPNANEEDIYEDTGFRTKTFLNTDLSSERCIAIGMGHVSRIWRVHFLKTESDPEEYANVNLLSFGEDLTCQQWHLEQWLPPKCKSAPSEALISRNETSPASVLGATLRKVKGFQYHTGKHLWAAATRFCTGHLSQVVTGGADGKLSFYDISHCVQRRENDSISYVSETEIQDQTGIDVSRLLIRSWSIEDVLEPKALSPPISAGNENLTEIETMYHDQEPDKRSQRGQKESLSRYAFVKKNTILAVTSLGRILLGNNSSGEKWREIPLPLSSGIKGSDLKSYSIIVAIPHRDTVLLTGGSGTIYVFDKTSQLREFCKVDSKVAGIFDIHPSGDVSDQILVTILGKPNAYLFPMSDELTKDNINRIHTTVRLPDRFVVTSANIIQNRLVLGSRDGLIALYDAPSTADHLSIFQTLETSKGDAVTSIVLVPRESTVSGWYILTTSRNGTYSIYSLLDQPLKNADSICCLELVHRGTPPLGPMIEKAWFSGSTPPSLFLCGFRNKDFIVWNETEKLEVLSVDCGGAHRTYTYLPTEETTGTGVLAYTKASRLCVHSQEKASHIQIKRGGHGREIKACGVSQNRESLIATGAEDTTIRIWRNRDDNLGKSRRELTCVAVLQKHTTGIQHLSWKTLGLQTYLFSTGGNEEFHIWRVKDIPNFGLGVVCVASLEDFSPEHDLRIMSVSATAHDGDEVINVNGSGKFKITLAYSDSTIRQYSFSEESGFRKLGAGRYTSACLTQIVSIPRANDSEKTQYRILSASTDGFVALWQRAETLKADEDFWQVGSRIKVHQSAILALDILSLNQESEEAQALDGNFLLATGGDDNALAFTLFRKWQVMKKINIPSAHAAAVTGIGFGNVPDSARQQQTYSMPQRLWTVGGDQRVNYWTIEIQRTGAVGFNNLRICELQDGDKKWSSILDAAGLALFVNSEGDQRTERCLVFGNGMEILDYIV